jgi:hypothetical protein
MVVEAVTLIFYSLTLKYRYYIYYNYEVIYFTCGKHFLFLIYEEQ